VPRVSALVVTWNSASDIEACVAAALSQDVEGGLEVVVLDNASADSTVSLVSAIDDPRLKVVPIETNTGYAEGNNRALEVSSGEVVLLLNPDCVMAPGCVQALVDHLDRSPGVGAVAATLRNPDGSVQTFARRNLTLPSIWWDLTDSGRRLDDRHRASRGRRERRYADEFERGLTAPLEVDCPAAACLVVWRNLVRRRLFDPALPLFFNDADLYERLRNRGYRIEVIPDAAATHVGGGSHRQLATGRKRAEFVWSMRQFTARHWTARRCLALWLLLATDVASALARAPFSRRRSALLQHARGTLGGLGLPGGSVPWLSVVPGPRSRVGLLRRRLGAQFREGLRSAARRTRRRRVLIRLRLGAWVNRSRLAVQIDPRADVASDLRVEQPRGQSGTVSIGPLARIQPGVTLRIWGGELVIGKAAEIRSGACLTVKGQLHIAPRVTMGRLVGVHADGNMTWGFGVVIGEGSLVIDSEHTADGSPVPVLDQPVIVRSVSIGPGVFIGAGTVVTAGVHIGAAAIIGARSVVTSDVPDRVIAIGSPARVVGEVKPGVIAG
jgi:GT2 family glycosyltransferase/acetyltransferase-like isoleucine patch superfamily enzyme